MTGQPDPYALTHQPQFPSEDLNEVRPSGRTIRRGKGWLFFGILVLAIGGIIASDKLSKSAPATAQGAVTAYGVGNIPLKDATPEEKAAVAEAEKKDKPKTAPKPPPPKRETALGRSDAFENPSQKYAEREVSSWNPSASKKDADSFANRRKSALGN